MNDCFDDVISRVNEEVIILDNSKLEISFACGEYLYNTVRTNPEEDSITFEVDAWFDSGVNNYDGYLPKELTNKIISIFPDKVGGFKARKLRYAKISQSLSDFVEIRIENSDLRLSFTEEEFKDMFRKLFST